MTASLIEQDAASSIHQLPHNHSTYTITITPTHPPRTHFQKFTNPTKDLHPPPSLQPHNKRHPGRISCASPEYVNLRTTRKAYIHIKIYAHAIKRYVFSAAESSLQYRHKEYRSPNDCFAPPAPRPSPRSVFYFTKWDYCHIGKAIIIFSPNLCPPRHRSIAPEGRFYTGRPRVVVE